MFAVSLEYVCEKLWANKTFCSVKKLKTQVVQCSRELKMPYYSISKLKLKLENYLHGFRFDNLAFPMVFTAFHLKFIMAKIWLFFLSSELWSKRPTKWPFTGPLNTTKYGTNVRLLKTVPLIEIQSYLTGFEANIVPTQWKILCQGRICIPICISSANLMKNQTENFCQNGKQFQFQFHSIIY